MRKRTKSIIMTVLFLMIIFGLTIINLMTPQKSFSENENRLLQELPKFSTTDFFSGTFSSKFETYTTDQFVARDSWVGMKSVVDLAIQKKDMKGVYFAKDDYLIEKYTQEDINQEQFQRNIKRLKEFVQTNQPQLGKEHLKIMVVPTASEILKDKLPKYAPTANQVEMLNQIEDALPEGSFINTFSTLSQHQQQDVYYHTDHHWTSYGAFLTYQQWAQEAGISPWTEQDFTIKQVTDDFYGTIFSKANNPFTKPDSISIYLPKQEMSYQVDFNGEKEPMNSLYNFEYLEKKDKYSMFLNGNNALVTVKTNQTNGKKLLIIKDSYAHSFLPFAANHFEEIHLVDFRYFRKAMSEYMEQEQFTDVLILYNMVNFAKDTNMGTLVK